MAGSLARCGGNPAHCLGGPWAALTGPQPAALPAASTVTSSAWWTPERPWGREERGSETRRGISGSETRDGGGPDRARQRDLPQQGMPLTSHAHCTEVDRHEQAPGPCPAPARPRATRRQRRALRQGHPERRGRASLRWRARARRRRSGHRRARRRKAGAGEGWRPAEACGRGGGAAVMLPIRREAPETRWEKGVWHSASFGLEWQLPCPGT